MGKSLLGIVCAVSILNFVIYWLIGFTIGGAAYGHVENGHYFLGNHSRFTEVSKEFFTLNQWHGWSLWITHPAFIVSAIVLNWLRRTDEKQDYTA